MTPRKFDHDEARKLHRGGVSYSEIGRRAGVTRQAVRRVCDPAPAVRDGQCEAYSCHPTRVGRRCPWDGFFDNFHQRVLCDTHADSQWLAFTPDEAREILRKRNRLWMRDWRADRKRPLPTRRAA